jgi:hypothetical protein
MKVTSRVRHEDKYRCVLQCIEKEKEGFECKSPIKWVSGFRTESTSKGKPRADECGYYEAVYQKEVVRH